MSTIRTNTIETLDSNALGALYAKPGVSVPSIDPSVFMEGQVIADDLQREYQLISGQWELKGNEDITVRVPTDYPNWQEAFDAYSNASLLSGKSITIVIESGHQLPVGLYISGGDYSYIKITSEDDVVQITPDFEGVFTQQVVSGNTIPRAFVNDGARSPILEIAVSGANYREAETSWHPRPYKRLGGLMSAYGSTTVFTGGSGLYGFRDFTGQGLYCRGARFIGQNTVFTNSGEHGAQMTGGSYYYMATSDFSGAWWNAEPYGLDADNLTDAGISTSRGSGGSAQGITCNDCGRTGIDIRRGSTLYNGAEVLRSAGQANLAVRNGGIAFANSINLGPDGVIELRPGGGIAFLGSSPTYGSIRTFSPPRTWKPNVLTPYGIVFDESVTGYGDNLVEEGGDVFEGYRLYSSGYCEMWKQFTVNASGTVDFDGYVETFTAPLRLKNQHPTYNDNSAGGIAESGVTFRLNGATFSPSLLKIQSNMMASYSPGSGSSADGIWTLRHPFTGLSTNFPIEGLFWARGYVKE